MNLDRKVIALSWGLCPQPPGVYRFLVYRQGR